MVKTANKVEVSKEPVATEINAKNADYQSKLRNALNWYTANCDVSTARKYLVEAGKVAKRSKESISALSALTNDTTPTTLAWCLRLLMRGAVFSSSDIKGIQQRINALFSRIESELVIEKAKTESKNSGVTPAKTIQEYMQEKVRSLLGELEGQFDDYLSSFKIEDKATYRFFIKENTPQAYMKDVIEWSDGKIREFGEAIVTKDQDLKDGYSNFSKLELGKILKYFDSIKQQAQEYSTFKKVNKAPRKRKEIPASKQVAKMKYKSSEPDLPLISISPVDIIGADQLWTFNTKTRILTVYRATGSLGLKVKGSSIINFDTETSVQKRLRKPAETLKALKDAGRVQLRKFMDTIKTKDGVPKGRVNAETILVRTG